MGYARDKVNPPMGVHIPGYYARRPADGIVSDLYINATALSDGENKAVVFSCDAIGIKADIAWQLRRRIGERCGIAPESVYINCTHSHTSFRITTPDAKDADPVFMERVYQQMVDCAQFAFEDLKATTLKIASTTVEGVGFMRRYRMKDGTCRTNPTPGDPNIADYEGVQDKSVQLIRAIREGGSEILFVNFGTHADNVTGTKFCADFPGYMADTLKGAFPHDVDVMMMMGCEGDSSSIDRLVPRRFFGCPENAMRLGRMLAAAVLSIYDFAEDMPADKISFASTTARVGKNTFDPAQLPEALKVSQIYNEQGREAALEACVELSIPAAVRIANSLTLPEFFELPVSALQIGNAAFIGLPGEPFVDIGVQIKKDSHMDMTIVTSITNGGEGHFPTAAAFAEKGYERSASPFAHNCAQVLIDAGKQLLADMKPLPRD